MRTVLFALILFACGTLTVSAQEWQAAGTVKVNGSAVPDVKFLKNGNRLLFPLEAMGRALNRVMKLEASGELEWDGVQMRPESLTHVEGVAYISWRDLHSLEPLLDYGVSGQTASFALRSISVAPAVAAADGVQRIKIVNENRPGAAVDPKSLPVPGFLTVVDFSSEYCGPSRRWFTILQNLVAKRKDVVVRKVDINRPGVRGIDWASPAAAQTQGGVPFFVLFDDKGNLLAYGDEGWSLLLQWCVEAGMTENEFRRAGLIQ